MSVERDPHDDDPLIPERIRRPLASRRVRQQVDEEIDFHLEMRRGELVRNGMGERDAREEALRRFGDVETTRSSCIRSDQRRERRVERREFLREAWRDVVVALRQIARRPAFAAAAVGTLAVGIGANTTIFSAADHVLFRPLPYTDVERVVTLWQTDRTSPGAHEEVAAANFLDWKERSRSFEALALGEPYGFDLRERERPSESVNAWLVTEEWFDALGVELALGRGFLPEEYLPDAPLAVVLPYSLWQERYAGDPVVLGRTLDLSHLPATVVGVLASDVEYPERDVMLAPKKWRTEGVYDERTERISNYLRVVGRLSPDVSLESARRDMDAVAAEVAAAQPATNSGIGAHVLPLREHLLGDVRTALLVLLGAVGFVLLIACSNVASLLLMRASERDRELAVRAALGAGKGRLVRQLLTESFVLSVSGGVLAVGLAAAGVRVLIRMAPANLPRFDELALDGRVLAFASGLTLLTTLLFGLAPALLTSSSTTSQLRGGGRSRTSSAGRSRLLGALVVGEVALAMVLLVGAGLLGRSFLELTSNDLGFDAHGKAAIQLFLSDQYPTAEQREQVVAELEQRLEAVPGVARAVIASALPFHPSQIDPQDQLVVEGSAIPAGDRPSSVYTLVTSPGYFGVMGIPLLRGRDFSSDDRFETARVALINESLAKLHFPGQDPIGRQVTVGVMSRPETREIVGVVGDVRATGFDAAPRPELYVPWAQSRTGSITFVVEAGDAAERLLPELRETVARVNPQQTLSHAATVEELLSATLVPRRFQLLVLGGLSVAAMVLSAIGIYGLVSYLTSLRTSEIGLRMALGAGRWNVVWMIVAQGLALAIPGVILGLGGALLLTRFLERLLYDVTATDPLTFVQLGLLMLTVAAAATYLPARRASAADPSDALRES